jgi:hypothetical protein
MKCPSSPRQDRQPPSARLPRVPFAVLVLLSVALAGCGASCGQQVLCTLRGPINDPSNFSLRRSILSQGLSEFCHQMITHDAPLKMTNDSPVIGRFFPQHCVQQELKNGDLYVQFDGFGYGYTNLSRKMTFTMSGAVDYDQDFRVTDDCNIYAFFRTRQISSSNFQSHVVEQPVASFLNSITQVGDNFGKQLVSGKLAEGFTVIVDPHQSADFAVGMIPLGQRPMHPFNVHGTDRITYENLRTEVHQGERDFIGPIEITEDHRALYLTATVDGAPAVTLYLMTKKDGDVSLGLYYNYPQIGPLNAPVLLTQIIPAGKPYNQTIPVQKGLYYIVLENGGGVPAPQSLIPIADIAATVSYAVQIGDAP